MNAPLLTVIINAHCEGLLAVPSLRSASRAIAQARQAGYLVEVLVVLDKGDALTRATLEDWNETGVKKLEVAFGDPGCSRNHGVENARGEFVAFLDADDLWGSNWLSAGLAAALNAPRPIVWHPEVNICFGGVSHVLRHIDMESEEFDPLHLVTNNYWTSLCLARTDLLRSLPYPQTDLAHRIGFEDWSWYRHSIACGVLHKVVLGTGHAIRVKEVSVNQRNAHLHSVPVPTTLFRKILEKRATLSAQPVEK